MAVREDNRAHSRAPLRIALVILFALTLSACAVVRAPQQVKIALFAPFEGRYREIGYNALYAARLALRESRGAEVELLAVDDGGTKAVNHARALAQDPQVMAVIALGYDATTPDVLAAFGDIPVIIVGEWGAERVSENVFIFSSAEIAAQLNTPSRVSVTEAATLPAPLVGSDVLALEGFRELRDSLDGVTILSSGWLPSAEFSALYKGDDPFAPEPGLLAGKVWEVTNLVTHTYDWESRSRRALTDFLAGDTSNSYWVNVEIHRYVYVDGVLTDDTVE